MVTPGDQDCDLCVLDSGKMPIVFPGNREISLDTRSSSDGVHVAYIVAPAPTTASVAKHVFNKYLSRERKKKYTPRIRKYGTHTSLCSSLEMYSKQFREETKAKANEWHL